MLVTKSVGERLHAGLKVLCFRRAGDACWVGRDGRRMGRTYVYRHSDLGLAT